MVGARRRSTESPCFTAPLDSAMQSRRSDTDTVEFKQPLNAVVVHLEFVREVQMLHGGSNRHEPPVAVSSWKAQCVTASSVVVLDDESDLEGMERSREAGAGATPYASPVQPPSESPPMLITIV